ncbi:MAG: PilZ domain-containing protein [Ilumatobacteraceae bacterium]
MRRNEHVGARVLALTGLVGGAAYLAWRLLASMDGTPAWLAGPFFVVELVALLATALLVWALWPVPDSAQPDTLGHDRVERALRPVDAVVRVGAETPHEVRATLLALRAAADVDQVVLLDLFGRHEVAALAIEFQAVYAAADPDDRNGLRVMSAAVRSSEFLLVDAGDVPTTDIVAILGADLHDQRVAVVQGLGVTLADDSPEHGPDRRHELAFERAALNPALGRRGAAVWTGSGALVRTHALLDVPHTDALPLEAHWKATAALHEAGWRITAPAAVPVVSHRAERDASAVYRERVERVRGAWAMLRGDHGALRVGGHTAAQRAAAMAWAVRPLSSLRRVAFIALLCAGLLAGEAPFHATVATMAILWLPYFAYTSLAMSLLSGWSLRPGDRTRWSLHNIGATFRSTMDPDVLRGREPIVHLPAAQYGASLVAAVIVLSVVLVLRGLSDRVTHTMGELPQPALLAMVTIALWLLALSLDVLRVLGRRSHRRRATRVGAGLAASLGDRAVSVLDITSYGAGVMSNAGFEVGERVLLEASVPTRTGVTTVSVPTVVRNVTMMPLGEWRLGLEFESLDDAAANALAEYCLVEPVWEQLGVLPGSSVAEDDRPFVPISGGELGASAGRLAMRVVSLLALVGAVASALPAQVEASALPASWSGRVVVDGTGVPGATLIAVCQDGDRQNTKMVTSDASGDFDLPLDGQQCSGYVRPPQGLAVTSAATAASVELVQQSLAGGLALPASTAYGVPIARVLSAGVASDTHLRGTLSVVVMVLIAVIAGSLLVGLQRPRRLLTA